MDGANPPPLARHYLVGKRYLHGKNRFPVTLRYVGLLPPLRGSEAGGSSASSSSSTIATWLGVEYDDASQGKHSGTFEGISVFRTRQEGAGAFIRLKSGNELVEGLTFVLAVEERYGRISSSSSEPDAGPRDHADTASTDETSGGTQGHEQFLLGSSNQAIVVEAPGLAEVQKRIGKLERLREIGLDGAWSSSLGADEETKEALRARLKGVKLLNLSCNLLTSWADVANIVDCLPGLQVLVLNDSRIEGGSGAHGDEQHLKTTFNGIKELHLGRCALSWSDVLNVAVLFPNLEELHLNGNPHLTLEQDDADTAQLHLPFMPKLKLLSVEGCGFSEWGGLAKAFGHLPSLETLNISALPISTILPLPLLTSPAAIFVSLKHLICLKSHLSRWTDIDALESWTSGRLESLRFSLAETTSDAPHGDYDVSSHLTGIVEKDRPILVAKLSGLKMLNSTPITERERRDAELAYIVFVDRAIARTQPDASASKASEWGRYDELIGKHGRRVEERPKTGVLKSKLITLHIYPELSDTATPFNPFTLSLLPTSPVSLLQKKVAKKLGVPWDQVRLWTVKRSASEAGGEEEEVWARDKVAEMEDGELGWWVGDGDGVVVEMKS